MDLKSVVLLAVLATLWTGVVSNTNPMITNPPNGTTTLTFKEDKAVGSILFTCKADDTDDSSTANGTISYNFFGGNQARKFSMDAATCDIRLVQSFDYNTESTYTLTIRATDGGGLYDQQDLTIKVEDVNNKPPSCTPSLIWGSLYENATAFTGFATLSCSDPDTVPRDDFDFRVILGNSSYSRSDTIGVSRTNNSAYIVRTFDFDKEPDTFPVLVLVFDKGNPSFTTTVTVILSGKDVDDNAPKFSSPSYQAAVDENADLGYTVIRINATDADKPNTPASLITFESKCSPDWLMIDRYSGDLVVYNDIDYEKAKVITCQVFASSESSATSTATVTVTVNNVNDGIPTFPQSSYFVSVDENGSPGQPVIIITAMDPDNDRLNYSIDSTAFFDIDQHTGQVKLNSSPDYEKQTSYLVSITAEDINSAPKSSSVFLQVSIKPVNEFSPVFVGNCSASVSEDSPPGTSVLTVSTYDNDTGLDGAVSLNILSQNVPFFLDSSSGFFGVATHLDYETTSSYSVIIVATDNSTTSKKSETQTCTISITDVDDQAVECLPPDIAVVEYPFPVNKGVAHVNCSVSSRSSSKLQYNITNGNSNGTFEINYSTGEVILKSIPLYQQYNLTIGVSYGADTTNVELIIFAEQKLNLTNLPQMISITEEQTVGLIFTVTACCVFKRVQFTILNGNNDKKVTLTSTNGEIRLMVPYDRESQAQHIYQIQASSESGQTATATLTVDATDINDNNPEFSSSVNEIAIYETVPPNSFIQRYTATDKDAGNNSMLTYNITAGNIGDAFRINDTGHAILLKQLDSETTSTYELEIAAFDMGSPSLAGTTLVVVQVLKNNTNPPQLVPIGGNYTVTLREDSALGMSVFQVQATDNHTNSRFTYGIISGNTNDDFQIVPTTGTVFIQKFLDRESTPIYILNVSATNGNGVSVFGNLYVDVSDVNDNSPVFSSGVIICNVSDEAPSGTPVCVLNVTDADLGLNANVTLTIESGNTANAFTFSGFDLKTTIKMNYPNVNTYRLNVRAGDSGSPIRSATALVVVKVVNQNIPYFNVNSATVLVSEDENVGYKVYDANATDKGAVEDGSIRYSISAGNSNGDFNIRAGSGEIVLAKQLDYERIPIYTLIMIASNPASSNPDVTFTLTVSVGNVNEYDPSFWQYSISFEVDEFVRPNTFVGTVLANDSDSGSYGQVTETMSGCTEFVIDPITGNITVKAILDYLVRQYYSCVVHAQDGGIPPREANASVVIRIRDINNHNPYFASATYVDVLDSLDPWSEIFQVSAFDLDTGDAGKVAYEIEAAQTLKTFELNRTTGILRTTELLDYRTTPSYTLKIRAYDLGIPSLDNSTTLTINVISTDPNRHNPVFPSTCTTTVTINRNSAAGTVVLACSATDDDNGISGEIVYTITSGNDDGYFIIDNNLGTVTTATKLTSAGNSNRLNVLATDMGKPPRNASFTLVVEVSPPIFKDIKADYNFITPENTTVSSPIGLITVDDGRTVSAYSIVTGNYGDAFDIILYGNNGNVVVKNGLDRELYSLYSLEVHVFSDLDVLSIIVKILVTDVNDNSLTFEFTTLNLEVPENSPSGTTVATISNTDLDTDAVNRNNTLTLQQPISLFSVDQAGDLTLISVPDYETTPQVTVYVIASDKQWPYHSTTLTVSVTIIDVEEKEIRSTSDITDNALISLEVPFQAPVGHLIYTLKCGDFSITPSPSAVIKFVAYQTTAPFSIQESTGDVTVSGSLANQTKYLLWALIKFTDGGNTTSKVSLMRIDTFDMARQMAVIEFLASYSFVQNRIHQFRNRAQEFFQKTQRIEFCNLLDTSTGSRRRLLALQAAAYTYVVSNTSADEMKNINEPKAFMTEKQILDVLQNSPDGTPVVGLSDPSVVEVATVEPFEEKTTSDDFNSFINTPAGIAVFCLLGLLIFVLIVLLLTCIFYRKYNKNRKSKKAKDKGKAKKDSFSRMPVNSSYFNSNPQIIVSAPPPVTLQNPTNSKPPTPPVESHESHPAEVEPKMQSDPNFQNGLPSQYGLKDGGKNPPGKKSKNNSGKAKVTKVGKSNGTTKRKVK